jgi:hypothetical protein
MIHQDSEWQIRVRRVQNHTVVTARRPAGASDSAAGPTGSSVRLGCDSEITATAASGPGTHWQLRPWPQRPGPEGPALRAGHAAALGPGQGTTLPCHRVTVRVATRDGPTGSLSLKVSEARFRGTVTRLPMSETVTWQ